MSYKGYFGTAEFDAENEVFYGEVAAIRDVVTFQGKSVAALKQAFHDSVDEYLAFCAEHGEAPDKPFSGKYSLRMGPELHQQVATLATTSGQSVNAWIVANLQMAVANSGTIYSVRPSQSCAREQGSRCQQVSH